MIGILFFSLILSVARIPSRRGIITSIIRRLIFSFSRILSASIPSYAFRIRYPSWERYISIASTISLSSSHTSMLYILFTPLSLLNISSTADLLRFLPLRQVNSIYSIHDKIDFLRGGNKNLMILLNHKIKIQIFAEEIGAFSFSENAPINA